MPIYNPIDGLKCLMEQRHIEKSEGHFPDGRDFVKLFAEIEEYLNTNVHPNTVLGAALHGDGLLTDHGVEHVQMVIRNAHFLLQTKQVGTSIDKLNGCEMLVLLLAAHFHDVGNIFGREGHERKINEIIDQLGDRWTLDTPETSIIEAIAMAHGGHAGDDTADKDTLRLLERESYWVNIPLRPAVLASVLRFADEISDDNTRASRFFNSAGIIPEKSKIFHEYSLALSPITINGNVISFRYYIKVDKVHQKISTGNGQHRYLYDEILHRLRKCLCELEYCRKYADGLISTTTLNAELNIMPAHGRKPIKTTKFSLSLKGYPSIDSTVIDTLEYQSGEDLNNAITEA